MNKNTFWLSWTLHCAAGELLGIGAAGAIAYLVNTAMGEPAHLGEKLVVLAAMMGAGAVEGTLLGLFQWRVLARKFAAVPRREWVLYTVAIAILGWFLGMLPSLFIFSAPEAGAPPPEPPLDFDSPWVIAALSIALGLVLGALFGLFQWFSLRKYAQPASRWILANALGWGAGLGWIYFFAGLPTENTGMALNVLAGVAGGVLAGLSVGAITGAFLVRMREAE